jgi:hypothetical protein
MSIILMSSVTEVKAFVALCQLTIAPNSTSSWAQTWFIQLYRTIKQRHGVPLTFFSRPHNKVMIDTCIRDG